jgi:hypothetical protein
MKVESSNMKALMRYVSQGHPVLHVAPRRLRSFLPKIIERVGWQ